MKTNAFLVFALIAALSCERKGNSTFVMTEQNESRLREYIREELNKYNSEKDVSNFSVWVRPISILKNNCAVYNFGRAGAPHSSRKNFFIFSKGELEILTGSKSVQMDSLEKFLDKNDFLPTEKDTCMREVIQILDEDTGVTF